MKLDKIITMASAPVRLRLLAMVRSLRATGCQLPVWVIPYSDDADSEFPLPEGCEWRHVPEVSDWVKRIGAHPMTRKYSCFLTANYQYADSDIVFLRNPEEVLLPDEGFVASCGHWRDPSNTMTSQSREMFRRSSTNWQREVFNAGQFACDRPLFENFETLHRVAHAPEHRETCLYPIGDQPGINLLRLVSGVPISNVTLPPVNMESTWAGDYHDEDYERFWRDENRRPYLIHWAGVSMASPRPIHELFYRHLTPAELDEWHAQILTRASSPQGLRPRLQRAKRRAMRAWDALVDG